LIYKLVSDNLALSGLALVAANLIPVIGVLLWGWDVTLIIGLYWIENLIIGVLNLPKIWMCVGERNAKFSICLMFVFHFGGFCLIHGALIGTVFMDESYPIFLLGEPQLRLTLIGLFLSHFLSFGLNFMKGREYEGRSLSEQMKQPYGRILIMHFALIFGSMLVQFLGSPIFALLVLIALKTGIDLKYHRIEHAALNVDHIH